MFDLTTKDFNKKGVQTALMKRFVIIMSPKYESFILEEVRRAGLPHLIEVGRPDFERLKIVGDKKVDYSALRFRLSDSIRSLLESETFEQLGFTASMTELKELGDQPEKVVNKLVERLEDERNRLERARIRLEEAKAKLIETRARIETLRALKPEDLKKCLAVGILQFTKIKDLGFTAWPRLEEHLLRFEDITYKMNEVSPDKGLLFVFGPEEKRSWVEALFMVFGVKDIFEALSLRNILLALNIKKRDEALKEYEDEVNALQKFTESEEEVKRIKDELAPILARAAFIDQFLGMFLGKEASLPGVKLVSVLEGCVPAEKTPQLKGLISEVEKKIGGSLLIKYEDSPCNK